MKSNAKLILKSDEAIFSKGSKLMTDSRVVAKVFGKQHFNVLRDIRNIALKIPNEFSSANFELTEYIDKNGDARASYNLTKDGFMLLIMGFTGEEAMRIKVEYVEAFNEMEKMIYDLNNDLITKFLHALEAEKQSFALASIAGRVLQKRKDEKQSNKSQIIALREQIQPLLPFLTT